MKIVIIGCGKVGCSLAEQLSREGHDVVAVDDNKKTLEEIEDEMDILTVLGNGVSLECLREAGVTDADLLIAATSADETNLLCCISAKKLGCRHTIARVKNPEYAEQIAFLKEELGLSLSVNPELASAQEIFRMIQFPLFLKRDSFAKGRVELVELKLGDGSILNNKKIMEINSVLGLRVLVCAVERNDEVSIPNGQFVLQSGDRITVTAARSSLAKLIKSLGLVKTKIKGVFIIGYSMIAEYLTEELEKSGVSVTLVEQNKEKCNQFAMKFPKELVIHGDASKKGFLESQGVNETDAIITLTGIDEENIITSMYASKLGVPKTVTKVDRIEYARLFDEKDIGSVVCPMDLTASEIVRYVRAMTNTGEGTVRALHRIVDGKAEALEFLASTPAPYINVPLMKLNIKPNTLITCISRGSQVIIPGGADCIKQGDIVIAVTNSDSSISDMKDLFEKEAVKPE